MNPRLLNGLISLHLLAVVFLLSGFGCCYAQGNKQEDLTASELLTEGVAAYRKGDYSRAERLLGQLVSDYGGNEEAKSLVEEATPALALSKVRLNKHEEALSLIETSLAIASLDRELRQELQFVKGVCHMKAETFDGAEIAFGEDFAERSHPVARRFEALLLFGITRIVRGDPEAAVKFFEAQMPKLAKFPDKQARAAYFLLVSQIQAGQRDEALSVLKDYLEDQTQVDEIVPLHLATLNLGAEFLEAEEYRKAIACFQRVWSAEVLAETQRARIDELQAKLATVEKTEGAGSAEAFQLNSALKRIENSLVKFRELESFDSSLRLRMAAAFQGMERYREAGLIMEDMLATMPADPVVEQASMSLMQIWAQLQRWDKLLDAVRAYLAKFESWTDVPTENVAMARFLKAEALVQLRKPDEAMRAYADVVEKHSASPLASQASFMRGFTMLQMDDCLEGRRILQALPERYPGSGLEEDVTYWSAMALSFEKEFDRARLELGEYLSTVRSRGKENKETGRVFIGKFRSDAVFQRAFCLHAKANYQEAIAEFESFLKEHPNSNRGDEAKLLIGDGLMALGKIEEGMASYAGIDSASRKFFEDGWFKTGKALKLMGKYPEMRDHFQKFIDEYGASNRVVEAVYWLGQGHILEARLEGGEAVMTATLHAREDAFSAIRKYGNRFTHRVVEDILMEMPKLFVGEEGTFELDRVLRELQKDSQAKGHAVLVARVHWVRALLQKKSNPTQGNTLLTGLGDELDLRMMSPRMLADVGDAHFADGKIRNARSIYEGLRMWHPRALERERSYAGLGFCAVILDEPEAALKWFSRYEAQLATGKQLSDVLVAKARVLGKLNRFEESENGEGAITVLHKILSAKRQPVHAKSRALLELGGVYERMGELAKAAASFERIYLFYGKDLDLVSRAYLRRGRVLEKLGKPELAREVYAQCLSRDELEQLPERALVVTALDRLKSGGTMEGDEK